MRKHKAGNMILRSAIGALALIMVPLVASRFVERWHWGAGRFLFVYFLFFAMGIMYALVAQNSVPSYKAGAAVSMVTGFSLGWSTMVQVADSGHPQNFAYCGVLAVGIFGALLARLEPGGLARTLFAMAVTLVLITVFLPSGAAPDLARRMAIGHFVFTAIFISAGLMFRQASLARGA